MDGMLSNASNVDGLHGCLQDTDITTSEATVGTPIDKRLFLLLSIVVRNTVCEIDVSWFRMSCRQQLA